jgi:hypothetical protein
MQSRSSTIPTTAVPNDASMPAELTGVELILVAGGLNPQPLPPRVEPEMRA